MNEKTIKRCWLEISLAYSILALAGVIFLFFELKNINDPVAQKLSLLIDASISHFFSFILNFLILYFCAYKKPGTRLLTMSIFFDSFNILYKVYRFREFQNVLNAMTSQATVIPEGVISFFQTFKLIILSLFLLSIFRLFFSFKLRQANKTALFNRMLTVPEYSKAFLSLSEASDYKDLYERYGKSVRENPEIAGHLKKAFKEKKTLLNSASFS